MLRRSVCHGIAVIMGLGFSDLPALASIAIVPDEYPSIQKAIDAGLDTVQVREGTYAERPLVERPLVIQGIGSTERPKLGGLEITNRILVSGQRLYGVSGCDLLGPVNITIVNVHPRNLELEFSECVLDSGIHQLVSLDTDDIGRLSIRNSRLNVSSQARAFRVEMSADTVTGGVSWNNEDNAIEDCWFTGGSGEALFTTATNGSIRRNRIEHYQVGIRSQFADEHTIEDNIITDCHDGVIVQAASNTTVSGNEITNCSTGISVGGFRSVYIVNNAILDIQTYGIEMTSVSFEATGNVVGRCGGSGIQIQGSTFAPLVANNSLFDNGESGDHDRVAIPANHYQE